MCYKNCKNATITEGFLFKKCMKCNIFMAEKSCNARERQLEKLRLKAVKLEIFVKIMEILELRILSKFSSKLEILAKTSHIIF